MRTLVDWRGEINPWCDPLTTLSQANRNQELDEEKQREIWDPQRKTRHRIHVGALLFASDIDEWLNEKRGSRRITQTWT